MNSKNIPTFEQFLKIKESPLSSEFDDFEDDDYSDFSDYYSDEEPQPGKFDKVFKGRRVSWIGNEKTIEVDSEYVSSREDNISNPKKVKAVRDHIRYSDTRVTFTAPPADVRIIDGDFIFDTQEANARGDLDSEYRIDKPFSTGDEDVDKFIYMDKKDYAEYCGLDKDFVTDEGEPDLEEIKQYVDEEDIEDTINEIEECFNDIKERMHYAFNKKTGDIGKTWAVLRDGNHRAWGAILAGETSIFVNPI